MAARGHRRTITLITDFGLSDTYVGVVKGVILGLNPAAVIVDLCHQVPPQDVAAAALMLGSAWRYFPSDTIHLAIVDPGVGSYRSAIAVASPAGFFVGPDNGIFSAAIRGQLPEIAPDDRLLSTGKLAPPWRIFRLTNPAFWRPEVSPTFHGRDIFAPVVAHLSLGIRIDRFGEPAPTVQLLPAPRPWRKPDGTLVAHVVQVDHFGNLITDLSAGEAAALAPPLVFRLAGHAIHGLSRFYAEGPALMAVKGSGGYVELAMRDGDAAAALNAKRGDEVQVIPAAVTEPALRPKRSRRQKTTETQSAPSTQ